MRGLSSTRMTLIGDIRRHRPKSAGWYGNLSIPPIGLAALRRPMITKESSVVLVGNEGEDVPLNTRVVLLGEIPAIRLLNKCVLGRVKFFQISEKRFSSVLISVAICERLLVGNVVAETYQRSRRKQ